MVGKTQTAVVIRGLGGPEVLEVVHDHPIPERKKGHVLVKTASTSVNPVDYKVRSGIYKGLSVPKILGGDVAGVVAEADDDGKFHVGDKVYALTDGFWVDTPEGTYAQYVSVPEEWLAKVPDNLDLKEAGGVPLVALTAWQALQAAEVKPGQRLLVHAGAGGVGHFVVQLAKVLGCYVVSSCGPEKVQFLKEELGADEVVNYQEEKVEEKYRTQPFDVVVDLIGGDVEEASYKLVQPGGHHVHILNTGTDQERIAQYTQAAKDGSGPKFSVIMVKPSGADLQQISDLIGGGRVKLVVDKTWPLEEVAEAHQYMEQGHAKGKVVITVD